MSHYSNGETPHGVEQIGQDQETSSHNLRRPHQADTTPQRLNL